MPSTARCAGFTRTVNAGRLCRPCVVVGATERDRAHLVRGRRGHPSRREHRRPHAARSPSTCREVEAPGQDTSAQLPCRREVLAVLGQPARAPTLARCMNASGRGAICPTSNPRRPLAPRPARPNTHETLPRPARAGHSRASDRWSRREPSCELVSERIRPEHRGLVVIDVERQDGSSPRVTPVTAHRSARKEHARGDSQRAGRLESSRDDRVQRPIDPGLTDRWGKAGGKTG
jgi:hypothetical protein